MADDTAASEDRDEGRGARIGVVIVIVAVIAGLLLLTKGYDTGSSAIEPSSESGAKPTVTVTTSTTLVSNAPAAVKVKAVNATNVQGLATKTRERLQAVGYTQVSVGDSPKPQERTTIYYVAGSEGDAQAVAKALGLNADQVLLIPEPPPVDLAGASVLVMAGLDLS